MKHTYIFKGNDPEMSHSRLQKLVNILRRTSTVSWKYEGNSDELTAVQCYVDGPSAYQLVSRAGINPDAWDQLLAQARQNGSTATGQVAPRLPDALAQKIKDARENLRLASRKARFIFVVGEQGITREHIDRMRQALGIGRLTVPDISRWEVRCTHTEIRDAARAAGIDLIALAVGKALQRGAPAMKQEMHSINYNSLVWPGEHNPLTEYVRKDSEVVCVLETLRRLREAGCQIDINPMSGNAYEIVVFGEAFTLLSGDEVRGFLAGLEKGCTSAPLWTCFQVAVKATNAVIKKKPAAKAPIVTRRSKRSC